MTLHDDLIAEPVLDQATAWAMRLRDSGQDQETVTQFDAWLAEDEAHAKAWAKTRQAWIQMGLMTPSTASEWPARMAAKKRRLSMSSGLRAATLAAAATALLTVFTPAMHLRLTSDFITSVAELREVTLADGSTVYLGADSAIDVAFAAEKRQVNLLKGEAYFDVTPDFDRPFVVKAAKLDVSVTGTKFDVAVTERSYAVSVAQGSVSVSAPDLPTAPSVKLTAGQGVIIDRKVGRPTMTTLAPSSVAAWRKQHLIVENTPLSDVVDTLNRYYGGLIVVTDEQLKQKRVTGGFDLNDPAAALRVLASPYDGVVRGYGPWLLILSAGS